jgi:hypothetical protein
MVWQDMSVCAKCHAKLNAAEKYRESLATEGEILSDDDEDATLMNALEEAAHQEGKRIIPSSVVGAAPVDQPEKPIELSYDPRDDTFTGTKSKLVNLAVRAVQELGWKLENANESVGFVTFETGVSLGSWSGVLCSVTVQELSENRFRLKGTAKQNVRGGQFLAINLFGEAQNKVNKVILKMRELLS